MKPDVLDTGSGVHFVEASNTNFVLITDGDEVTVVDSGYPKDRDLLEASVREIGRSLTDVSAMLLTHAHVDHLGSAEWLRRDFGVPVHCHADEAAYARGETEERISELDILIRLWRPQVMRFLANVVVKGGLDPMHVQEVTTFSDGETIDAPGTPVAVHSPGHTSGHAGFHLPDRGVLLTGDALITVDVWNHRSQGPQVIAPPFNHDHEQAVRSLARFEDLDAEVLIPGHGRPYRVSPAHAVEEARRNTETGGRGQ